MTRMTTIVDAHQHFIKFDQREYPWIRADMTELRRDLLPADFLAAAQGLGERGTRPGTGGSDVGVWSAGVFRTVAVEARQSLEETRWLLEIARSNPLVAGVVGWADLCDPDLDSVLEQLSADPHLNGLRHVLHDEPNDNFMLRDDFRRGIARLARYGLSYDILIFPRHLPQTLELVRSFPDQPFVIDHMAKPRIREGELSSWHEALRPVAAYPNVYCKLSGLVTEASPHAWKPQDFLPYIDTVMELFGPARLMFGSDWPVCTLEAPYAEVLAIVDGAIARLNPDERESILRRTAESFYHLSTAGSR